MLTEQLGDRVVLKAPALAVDQDSSGVTRDHPGGVIVPAM